MCKVYKVSVLVLCSYFACFSRCENVAPDPCPNGQSGCKITDKSGDTNATNAPTNALASSPLSSDDSKTHQPNVTDGRARAMNFTSAFQDDMKSNGLETGLPLSAVHKIGLPPSSTAAKTGKNPSDFRIDNVSMDDDDDSVVDGDEFNVANNYSSSIWRGGDAPGKLFNAFHGSGGEALTEKEAVKKNGTATMAAAVAGGCVDRGDKFYKLGEKFNRGCDESCQCLKDGIICSLMCKMPLQVKGRNKNAQCTEEPVEGNSCCVRLTCAIANVPDLETEPIEDCVYKNTTYKRGATIKDGCEAVCTCEAAGRVNCKSRCPPVQNATENCVTLPDQRDPCCKVVLCDVEEHDVNKIAMTGVDEAGIMSSTMDNHIVTAKALNETSVAFTFSEKSKDCNVESSTNGIDWETIVCRDNVVTGLLPGKKYQFRLKNVASNKVEVALPSSSATNQTVSGDSCTYKGKIRKIGEEFHDGCTAFCVCEKTGIDCAPIECPTDFGLDVLDPQCVDWETFPPDFVPTPPHCCPEKVHCRNNGSCVYDGKMFPNWSELPSTVTGCDKTCYCEMGNVSCQSSCPQVSNTPPAGLHCPPEQAVLTPPTDDNCCPMWVCPTLGRNGNDSNTTLTEHETIKKPLTITKPTSLNDSTMTTGSSMATNASKNSTVDDEFYPGPFSLQFMGKTGNASGKPAPHHVLTDLLTPFHLEEYASQIEKELHSSNATTAFEKPEKKPTKKPTKTHPKDETLLDSEEDDTDEDEDKHSYDDLFSALFESKGKGKPSSSSAGKHPLWPKPIEIPELVKNPQFNAKTPSGVTKEYGKLDTSANVLEYPSKKHNVDKDAPKKSSKPIFDDAKPRPDDDDDDQAAVVDHFGPPLYTPHGVPYKHQPHPPSAPPREILIHQGQPPLGFANKYKPPPSIGDPNQPDEYAYHVVDNDAYNEEQIRQNLQYGSGPPLQHPQYGGHHPHLHAVKVDKNGGGAVRVQNGHNTVNVDEVLTHLNNENNNNNVHLPNMVAAGGGGNVDQRLHNVIHTFAGFPNYHETLNVDQTSATHPLLLHPQLVQISQQDVINDTASREEIKMKVLEPVDENTIKLVFSVPTFLVGLNGRIELRYTSDQQNNEPSTWEQQILAPPNDLIATKELEFELGGLQPNTTYKIKISVMMHDFENAPSSSILTIRTPPSATPVTTLPPIIPVEPELRAIEVNSTFVKIAWRMFTDTELQFIDGVQLRYKEIDDKIYSATPLIHRAVTTYTIEELKPDTVYEVGIFFIPFPGQMTELQFHRTIQIRTSIENDPYKFEVMMDVHHVKSTSIEISWSGVPYPEDKFVHIFRAIYQSEGSREDVSSFKAAKRDSPQSILIQDLKPGTRYRLWLEVYLTNGRTKKSNVKDFVTKLGPSSSPSASQGKLEGMALMESSSYYGPLVAVSIFATIATMSTVILLLILAKKHGTNKAPITSPINRKNNSSAAYDNPSYKTYENDRNGCNPKNGSIALSVFPKTHIEKEA